MKLTYKMIYNFSIFPRTLTINTNEGLVNIDIGEQCGTHWTFSYMEDNNFFFDSFGGLPDKFLLIRKPKPTTYHSYQIQDINIRLSATYLLYFFYLIERMYGYDAFLKT